MSQGSADGEFESKLGALSEHAGIVRDARVAAEWIAIALSGSGYALDFKIKSLKEIDRFFDEHAPQGIPRPGGLLSENFGNRMFSIGAYVGEVICRRTGAKWQGDEGDPDAEINIAVRFKRGQIIWPVQRVMKRFQNGPQDSVYGYGVALADFQRPPFVRRLIKLFAPKRATAIPRPRPPEGRS
jgi:hypothetical protein